MRSQDIEIPEPCHADWDAMRPEDRGRYCFECRKKVHDLSSMTEDEAEQFLARTACEDVCISYEHDDEGTLVFRTPAPRPAPLVPLARLRRPRSVAAAVAGMGMAAALAACAPHGDGPPRQYEAEAAALQMPADIIPHGNAPEATPVPPQVEDEPCDPVVEEVEQVEEVEPTPIVRPRVRGKIRRTAGVPIRKKGTRVADPLASL